LKGKKSWKKKCEIYHFSRKNNNNEFEQINIYSKTKRGFSSKKKNCIKLRKVSVEIEKGQDQLEGICEIYKLQFCIRDKLIQRNLCILRGDMLAC